MPLHSTIVARLALLIVSASSWAACVESNDPSAQDASGDASVQVDAGSTVDDAGERDARPDLDAQPRDANELLDAAVLLDAAPVDSGLYATEDGGSCFLPVPSSCAPRTLAVSCGTSVCSGATPVCCRERWSQDGAPVCVAKGALCFNPPDAGPFGPITANLLDRCDDTSDCEADEICIDSLSKGLWPRVGANCAPTCQVIVANPFAPYGYQLCKSDCECVASHQCVNGTCAKL